MSNVFYQSPGKAFEESPAKVRNFPGLRRRAPWSVGIDMILGGKRIQGLRPYYIAPPCNTLAWQEATRRWFMRQDVTITNYSSGWIVTGWDDMDGHGNMTTSGNYPITQPSNTYTTWNPPWYRLETPVPITTGNETEFHHTERFPVGGTFQPWSKIDAALSGELDFPTLLGSVATDYNALDFDSLSYYADNLSTIGIRKALVEPSEYRATAGGSQSLHNVPIATGYTGNLTNTTGAGALATPYTQAPSDLASPYHALQWYSARLTSGTSTATVLPLNEAMATVLPGGATKFIMGGWQYFDDPENFIDVTALTADSVCRTANNYSESAYFSYILASRARVYLQSGDPQTYWVGVARMYTKIKATYPYFEVAIWPQVSVVRSGTVSTSSSFYLNIPTIAGTTDFVTIGSGDDTGLSFGALEFAIIGESQESWATRTGFTLV